MWISLDSIQPLAVVIYHRYVPCLWKLSCTHTAL